MEPIAQKFHARLGELATLMEQKKETLIALLQKDDDPASIESLRKEMAGIQDEIQKEVITHIMESKQILDPNQQQRFFDLMRDSMIQAKNSWPPTNGGK
jgi:Spy/CpxP family protein refolding chaperone